MIISISGTAGSGKSTLAKMLAKKLGYEHYSMGDIRREVARQHKITLSELNKLGESEDWTDKETDQYLESLGKDKDNFVVDSRTAFHFIPSSVKLFIDVSPKAGAERIFKALQANKEARNEDKRLNTLEDVLKSNIIRKESDNKRYQKYYSIEYLNHANYDLVLDSTDLSIDEAFNKLYEFIKGRLKD